MLTETEYALLVGSTSAAEWARVCVDVKTAHGGSYPEDWYERVIKPGLMRMIGLDATMVVTTEEA